MKKRIFGNLMLLTAALIWGLAFVAQSVGMDYIGPFTFQFSRSLLAVLVMLPTVWLSDRKKDDGKSFFSRWKDKELLKGGLICGLAMFTANSLQQVGLVYTSPGKSGFITAMYIVLVPVLGLFLKRRVTKATWISVLLALVGLYLLSLAGAEKINIGDLLTLLCALVFAVQITGIDHYSPKVDCLRLSFLQTSITCILSIPFMLLTEEPHWADISACAVPILYSGILSMALAYTLQITGQKYASNAALASLIMSLESVFAALFGWLILGDRLSARELLGCALVFSAILLAQMPSKAKKI